MFPYVEPPVFELFGRTLHFFWLTTVLSFTTGFFVCLWRARKTGFDVLDTGVLTAWIIFVGLVGAHVLDVLLYNPQWVLENPGVLLDLNTGLSSFGGMASGVGTALFILWRRKQLHRALAYVDAVAFGFPFAWLWGRLGCAVVHDHMGKPTTSFLAVQFPEGPRYDLGLLELLYTVPIAVAWVWLVRKPRPTGFFIGWFLAAYSPVRFFLDFLRTDDATYLGLTPGQYFAMGGTIAGVILVRSLSPPGSERTDADPQAGTG
jgi:phosphatidylglycerol:prolipoprotein diacylglycerol transferase